MTMRHIRRWRVTVIGSLALVGMVAGCGQPSDAPTNVPAAETPDKPAFAVDGPAAITAIKGFGTPWNAATAPDPMVDTATGGTVRVLNAADGSAQVFSRRNGRAWQVKLVTGAPGHCGTAQPLLDALPKLAALLRPGATVAEVDRNAVSDGLLTLGRRTRSIAGIDVTTQGGCTHWLTLAVPSPDRPAT